MKHHFIVWKTYNLCNHFLVYLDCTNLLLSYYAVLNIFVVNVLSIATVIYSREIPSMAIYVSKNMHILGFVFLLLPNHLPEMYLSAAVYENSHFPTW